MRPFHNWSRTCLRLALPLAPVLLFALPAAAQVVPVPACPPFGSASCPATDPGGLADTAEPGSVLVFPKFDRGTVIVDPTASGGLFPQVIPKTEIEIGAVCPGFSTGTPPQVCTHSVYQIHVHWVCPGVTVGQVSSVCKETDFEVFVSTNGKIVFNPNGTPARNGQLTGFPGENGNTPVPVAECERGYALAYVVNSVLAPIKHDVLVGDAVMRNTVPIAFPLNGQDLQSYSALAIQADPNLKDGGPIVQGADPVTGTPTLVFDGNPGSTPLAPVGHYQTVAGQFEGDIRFSQDDVAPFADTQLILLTLDVRSNLHNDTTFVSLDFYNQREVPTSTFVSFDCWLQIQLTDIDANLNRTTQGTPSGMVVSGQAIDGEVGGNRTLLALIQTTEGAAAGPINESRSYTVRPSNNSIPVATFFTPF